MQTLKVDLGPRSYPIHIGQGLINDQTLLHETLGGRRPILITDKNIAKLYLTQAAVSFGVQRLDQLVLQPGETNKSLSTLESIFDFLMARKCDRQTVLVALGGGVVGDMVGFAAACFQRGIDFIQVPTTLLAQVDSSVGGKTAVNHPHGKNMIGAFHQPIAVIIDTDTLSSLPSREITAGIAEVIKYGLIRDQIFFTWLETNLAALQQLQPAVVAEAIARSCYNKAAIVSLDETELGLRAILNLGHSFGHAVETSTGYQSWLHGEAVGLGIRMATALSVITNSLAENQVLRIEKLLTRAGLPLQLPAGTDPQQLLALIYTDKKTESGALTFITLKAIGEAFIHKDIADSQVLEVIGQFLAPV